jgi:hypothetical protein
MEKNVQIYTHRAELQLELATDPNPMHSGRRYAVVPALA